MRAVVVVLAAVPVAIAAGLSMVVFAITDLFLLTNR